MKKLLYLLLLFVANSINSCNLCRDFEYTGQWLRRAAREIVECDCNCWQHPKVKNDQGYGYGCVVCGHRLLPEKIFEEELTAQKSNNPTWDPTNKKYIRYEQAETRTSKESKDQPVLIAQG